MEEMIAFCGLSCHLCPTYIATKEDNDERRTRTAKKWSQTYEKHKNLKPEDIVCDGCLAEGGRLFTTCSVCPVRKCGIKRKVENCAYCEEYPCQKLEETFSIAPESKKKLDEIKSKLLS